MPALSDIAVVIPIGPGDHAWQALVPQLQGIREHALAEVRDGGPGRARQMNQGAADTTCPWLWFLHADSRLADDTLQVVADAPDLDYIGFLDLRFHDGPALMLLNAFFANLRSRWFGLPFGDQGFLVRRAVFEKLGGFDESLERAEDHAFIWKARHAGVPVERLGARIYTSARRYSEEGWLRVTARHVRQTIQQARLFSRRPA